MIAVNRPIEPSNLLAEVLNLVEQQIQFALLTLINIEGSAPYPLGSQMLVSESGQYWGQITGGCAETALADQAVAVMREQRNQTHRYGLNSPYFDIQLPCGSGIDVHFDVSRDPNEYRDLTSTLEKRQAGRLPLTSELGEFVRHYLPQERLLVFGQGPILLAMLRLAASSNFETISVVQDESDRAMLGSHGFESSVLHDVGEAYSDYLDSHAAVVSLFHEHDREIPILTNALQSSAFYIGALGSQRTQAQRLETLRANGLDEESLARIHGPVGMDIGAETPAQIAISIMAEVVSHMPKIRQHHG